MPALLTAIGLFLGLLVALTGLYLGIRDAADLVHAINQLLHVALGWVVVIPTVIALRRHHQVRGTNATGWMIVAILTLVGVSGMVQTVYAMTASPSPSWMLPVHLWTSIAITLLVGWHVVAAWSKKHRRWVRRWAAPSLGAATLAILVASGVGAWLGGVRAAPVVEGYSEPYEGGPFKPANVVIEGETSFVHPSRLAGSEACGRCHGDIYRQWSESMHRYAASDPHVVTGVKWFQRDNGVEAGRFCAGCHNPIPLLAGQYDPSTTPPDTGSPVHDEGISCLSCHAMTKVGMDPLGNGSFHLTVPAAPAFTGALADLLIRLDPTAHKAEMIKRPLFEQPEFCATCHQQYTPIVLGGPGPGVNTHQFHEWQDSKYAVEGSPDRKTCNDCHMPLVAGDDPAAVDGKIHSHRFIGANHGHAVASGHDEQARLTLEFLQSAITLTVAPALEHPKADHLTLEVKVTNTGAGHNFPSGTTDISQTWLEVVVGDPQKPLLASGLLDAQHYLDEHAHQWRKVFVDSSNVPVDLHNIARVADTTVDDYIEPGATDTATYHAPLGGQREGRVPVRVRLRMRKANQRWNDWLSNFAGYTEVVTDVVDTTIQVDLASHRFREIAPAPEAPPKPVVDAPKIRGMVYVPAGPVVIGAADGDADERPVHTREVQAFYIDIFPVTNAEYRRFLRATNGRGPVFKLSWANKYNWTGRDYPAGMGDRPVVLVNHDEADGYCAWAKKRLPREVEWEKAARGPDGLRYPWGDDWLECPPTHAMEVPERVGMCPERASPYGMQEAVGGVFEWVHDSYLAYDRTFLHPNANEWITTFGDVNYVLRGVPNTHAGPATTAASRAGHADNMRAKIGFRCVQEPDVEPLK